MDPLSIATTAGSAIAALYTVSEKTYKFAKDAKIVDQVLSAIRSELSSLLVVLETVKSTLRKPQQLIIARAEDNSTFLSIIHAAVQECRDTAETIEQILGAVEDKNESKSIVARSIRQVRFLNRKDELRRTQARLKAQKTNLQLLLHILNASIAHYPASVLKDTISPQMNVIEAMLKKALLASSGEEGIATVALGSENSTRRIEQSDSTDSRIGNDPASMLQSSVEAANRPPLIDPSLIEIGFQEPAPQSVPGLDQTYDLDSDDEIEAKHTLAAFTRGKELCDAKFYPQAEKILRSCLKTAAGVRNSQVDKDRIKEIQLHLAFACIFNQNWDDAHEILSYLTAEDTASEREAVVQSEAYLALGRVYLAKEETDSAIAACKEARAGFRKIRGKLSASFKEATRLLILSYVINGDVTAIDFYDNDASVLSMDSLNKGLDQIHTLNPHAVIDKTFHWLRDRGVALIIAAGRGYNEAMQMLLWIGVNINATNASGETALIRAAARGQTNVVQFLIDHGAYLHLKDSSGNTALANATNNEHRGCEIALLGTDVKSRNGEDDDEEFDSGPHVQERRKLLDAASEGRDHIIRKLLLGGLDVNSCSYEGRTALSMAAENGHESTVAMLLKAGADPNLTMTSYEMAVGGFTALMYAALKDRANIAAYLIKYGANVDAQCSDGSTALDIAIDGQKSRVGAFLNSSGASSNLELTAG